MCVCVLSRPRLFFYSSISEASPLTYLNKSDDGVLFFLFFLKGENVPRKSVWEAERNDEHFEYYCLPECILNTSSICFSNGLPPVLLSSRLQRKMNSPFPLLHSCIFYNLSQDSFRVYFLLDVQFDTSASGAGCVTTA